MKCMLVFVCLCSLLAITYSVLHDLPSYIKKCHRFDPNINQCLLNNSAAIKPYLINGIPELNFPALEPFVIPSIVLEQGTQALNFKASLNNITVKGLTNYNFTQFDFDHENIQWFLKGSISPLNLEGDYVVVGKVLIAPIEGKGHFKCSVENTNITIRQRAKAIEKNGQTYLRTTFTNTSIEVGGPKVKLEGLFGGNQQLNKVTNKVINDNINELFLELRPVVEKVIETLVKKTLLESLEMHVPYDNLYPPIP